jgi:site-specific recombinase XerD
VFRNQSKKTEENHYVCLRALLEFFGDRHIESLSFEDVRNWKIHLDEGRAPKTVRCYIIKLRVVLAYLKKKGVDVVDVDLIPLPKAAQRPPQFLSKEEVAVLIKSTSKIKNKAIISLLYASGIRISELCALNREQIKIDSFTVVGKGGKARLCFLDERTRLLLDLYLETRDDNNPALFLTDAGKRIIPWTVQETFKTIRKRSGIEAHPHTLRHSFATDLMNNGMHIYQLQRLLGHSSIDTTAMYLHVSDPQLAESYKVHHKV